VNITFPDGSFFDDTTISINGVPDSVLRDTELDGNTDLEPQRFILTPPIEVSIPDNTFGGTTVTIEYPIDPTTIVTDVNHISFPFLKF